MESNRTEAGSGPATVSTAVVSPAGHKHYSDEEVRQLMAALEEPFDPREIKWRVTNTTADKRRGQMLAYADPRAYTDRLNQLFTVRGWTREYSVQTINNVERKMSNGTQIAGKIVVTCRVTIHGLGAHSGIGEEWADNENAGTAAEAQAFKRACSCFGLGRYLYNLEGDWVDLDQRKQPKSTPKLPKWTIPKRQSAKHEIQKNHRTNGAGNPSEAIALQARISAVAEQVGYSLSRSVLMGIAQVDEPGKVPRAFLGAVAAKLDDTLRGVERLRAATAVVGNQRYAQLCRDLNFASDELGDIPDREALRKLLETLEQEASKMKAAARQNPTASPAVDGTPANGSGRPSPTSGKDLGSARSALIKEAQRVARLKGMTVAQVVDRAAKGAFTFSGLQRLTAETLPTIQAATNVLRGVR